jgi:hypothetical protein
MNPKLLTFASALVLFGLCGTGRPACAANKPQVVSATVDFTIGYGQAGRAKVDQRKAVGLRRCDRA